MFPDYTLQTLETPETPETWQPATLWPAGDVALWARIMPEMEHAAVWLWACIDLGHYWGF